MKQSTGKGRKAWFWVGVVLLSISAFIWLILVLIIMNKGDGAGVLVGVVLTFIPIGIGIYGITRGRRRPVAKEMQRLSKRAYPTQPAAKPVSRLDSHAIDKVQEVGRAREDIGTGLQVLRDEKKILKAYLKAALKFVGLYMVWFALGWLPAPILVFIKSQHPEYMETAIMLFIGYVGVWLFVGLPLWYVKMTKGSRTLKSSHRDSLSRTEIENKLLQLNEEQDYFKVKKLDDRMVAEWNLSKPTLRDILIRSRLGQNYKMILAFDEKSRTAGSVDRVSAGYKGFSLRDFSFQFSHGLIIEFETEPILELLNVLKKGTYDPKTFRLNTLAVKIPVIKTILESGWNYRIKLF